MEQPANKGLLASRNMKSGEVRWLAAAKGEKVDRRTARFSVLPEIDGAKFSWAAHAAMSDDRPRPLAC